MVRFTSSLVFKFDQCVSTVCQQIFKAKAISSADKSSVDSFSIK